VGRDASPTKKLFCAARAAKKGASISRKGPPGAAFARERLHGEKEGGLKNPAQTGYQRKNEPLRPREKD